MYRSNTKNTFNNAIFKWFWTIFSLGAPDCAFDKLKESQSNQKTFYFYFCVLHFPVMNIEIFNYTSRSLSITAIVVIVIFDFQWVLLEYYNQLPPAEEFWSLNLNYKTKSFA